MRYYAIKISQGADQSSLGDKDGLAFQGGELGGSGSSTPTPSNFRRSISRLGFGAPKTTADNGSSLGTLTEVDKPLGWDPAESKDVNSIVNPKNADISGMNVNLNIPKVPSTVKAVAGAPITGAQWTSVVNGVNDPGALDIEFDITNLPNSSIKEGWLKIWGVTPQQVSQASKFTNLAIELYGGFVEGLPLANLQVPHQGLLMDGLIFPSWGNWILNELSLEFKIKPSPTSGPGGPTKPKNIVHNMPANQPLKTTIQNALSAAFPGVQLIINISDKLKLPYPDKGFYSSIEQYAQFLKPLSHSILGTYDRTGYNGVVVIPNKDKIIVTDRENKKSDTIDLKFEDLVGQPTWIGLDQIQIKTLLRADISPTSVDGLATKVTLPKNILTSVTEGGAIASTGIDPHMGGQNLLNFQGSFDVIGIRHCGHFRQPTGEAWVTIINALAPAQGGATDAQPKPLGQGGIGHA